MNSSSPDIVGEKVQRAFMAAWSELRQKAISRPMNIKTKRLSPMTIPLSMCVDLITPDYEVPPTTKMTQTTNKQTAVISQAVVMVGNPPNVSVVFLHKLFY